MHERRADLLSVAGHQEMHSFWERVIQPQMFALIAIRYGGTEHVSNAKRPEDAIANGQFIAVSRDAYDAIGGHALVRDRVAEDLSMAQEFVRAGRRVVVLLARQQLSTHMYASLREIVGGWRKNIYAGGRHATLGGAVGRVALSGDLDRVAGHRTDSADRARRSRRLGVLSSCLAHLVGNRRGGCARSSGWRFTVS